MLKPILSLQSATLKTWTMAALFVVCFFSLSQTLQAQTTGFTYQGKLADAGAPATGPYDLTFKLFPIVSGGAQIGADIVRDDVQVTTGVFTVSLDFGSSPFTSDTARYLEIAVRPGASTGAYTTLVPRQPITSSPYSVSTIRAASADVATNALQLGGVAASQFVQTGDARLSDARTPTVGSTSYIQNRTTPQASSNFNIGGNGTAGGTLSANIVQAATQYNIGGDRVLSVSSVDNLFAGFFAGAINTGNSNSFFGESAGYINTSGGANAFFGTFTGFANSTGSFNTLIGAFADVGSGNLTNATAIGADAVVSQSNSMVLGGISGVHGGSDTNVGIGTTAPTEKLQVASGNVRWSNSILQNSQGGSIELGGTNTIAGSGIPFIDFHFSGLTEDYNARIINDFNGQLTVTSKLRVATLGSGSTSLCRDVNNVISDCSSSLRYKTNIKPFSNGLNFINRLRPIAFSWKDGGMKDVGFGAEDVAKISPLLVTYNASGQVEGVKYDRLSVIFVNAFKEQQLQLDRKDAQIRTLQSDNAALNARLSKIEYLMQAFKTAAARQPERPGLRPPSTRRHRPRSVSR